MPLGVILPYVTATTPPVSPNYQHARVQYQTVFSVIPPKQAHVSYARRNYYSKRTNACPDVRRITSKTTRHAYPPFHNAKYTPSLPIDTNRPFPRTQSPQIPSICSTPEIGHTPPMSPTALDYTSHKNSCSKTIHHRYKVKLIIYNKFVHSVRRGMASPKAISLAIHVLLDVYSVCILPHALPPLMNKSPLSVWARSYHHVKASSPKIIPVYNHVGQMQNLPSTHLWVK